MSAEAIARMRTAPACAECADWHGHPPDYGDYPPMREAASCWSRCDACAAIVRDAAIADFADIQARALRADRSASDSAGRELHAAADLALRLAQEAFERSGTECLVQDPPPDCYCRGCERRVALAAIRKVLP